MLGVSGDGISEADVAPQTLDFSFSQIKHNYVILSHINTQKFIFILQRTKPYCTYVLSCCILGGINLLGLKLVG